MISVIIPCYNVEQYIDRCLDSLVAQTIGLDSLEIICLDDRSSDGTRGRLKAREASMPGILRVIELPENGRQGRARNIGLNEARGEWVAFIDSDDWVEPDYLERLIGCAEASGIDPEIVTCGYDRDFSDELNLFDRTDEDGSVGNVTKILVGSFEERRAFVRERKLDYAVYSKLIRRDFLLNNNISFPEGLAYEDIYWGGLINMYASRVCGISDKLYHYYVNRNSTLLSAGAGYHYDMLTVQEQLWSEYIRRGLMDDLHDEIELEFVYSCALAFWKIIALRFEEPPYNMYLLLCTFTQTHISDIWDNPYVKQGALPEMYTLMLQSLFSPLDKGQFLKFADNIKTIGI